MPRHEPMLIYVAEVIGFLILNISEGEGGMIWKSSKDVNLI